jgi:ribosome-associated protein
MTTAMIKEENLAVDAATSVSLSAGAPSEGNESPTSLPRELSSPLSPEDETILAQVQRAAFAVLEKKGEEVLILRLTALTEFTDYFLICTGNSIRQTQAIADEITSQLKEIQVRPLHTEGFASGEWILIDYGTFVVHIFSREARRFYDLERLWRDAERVDPIAPQPPSAE